MGLTGKEILAGIKRKVKKPIPTYMKELNKVRGGTGDRGWLGYYIKRPAEGDLF